MTPHAARAARLVSLALVVAAVGCASDGPRPTTTAPEPGAPVAPTLPPALAAQREALLASVSALESLTADELLARRAPTWEALPYDPLEAVNLPLIEATPLALTAAERARLGRDGFVVRGSAPRPSFNYAYEEIYAHDLPVFVSADAILEAVHRSYDDVLQDVERGALLPALRDVLGAMRSGLAGAAGARLDAGVRVDLDVYLAVPYALLTREPARCVAGCDDAEARRLVAMAEAHSGLADIPLFGTLRENEDFSQFEPRGHYADDEDLRRYFRAMMWLGRVDLRIIETRPDHTQVFRRGQLLAAFGMRGLLDAATLAQWEKVDRTITAFVGEHDSMTLPQLDGLLAALGVASPDELDELDDAIIAQAILDGVFGAQRISSHIMINGTRQGTMPLSSSFALFGQRYTVDSHVLSNVSYDRVNHTPAQRLMPSTLDVAYAALANDHAARFLAPELATYAYAPDLEVMRTLVDAHGDTYWESSLYTTWLSALRALSPRVLGSATVPDAELPPLTRSEAWSRRILNTQLASWAELRHDTILYAKQSYTNGNACEFPDAYVEPYPAFFDALTTFAARGAEAVDGVPGAERARIYFVRLAEITTLLGDMARAERIGVPFDAAQMAFINDIVRSDNLCGVSTARGWYSELHYDAVHATEFDPTIADIHTQPTDEGGNFVGRVLHVGTGRPRLAVFTFETCSGPRAYVGVVSTYHETITQDFERLTDDAWTTRFVDGAEPPSPAFLGDLIAR